jgi:hypothetical protein
MYLDGSFAHPEAGGDDLVAVAARKFCGNLPLSCRQSESRGRYAVKYLAFIWIDCRCCWPTAAAGKSQLDYAGAQFRRFRPGQQPAGTGGSQLRQPAGSAHPGSKENSGLSSLDQRRHRLDGQARRAGMHHKEIRSRSGHRRVDAAVSLGGMDSAEKAD